MEHLVIVRAEAPDRFTAQAVGIPEVRAVGTTEQEAIEQVSSSLAGWLASAKLVRVRIPTPEAANPWLATFGRSAGDPDFDELCEEMRRARQAADEG